MKIILQINTVINSGSTGRIAEEIGQTGIANGWQSYIAFGRNERPSQSEIIQIGNNWDIKLHGLKTRLFDSHGLGSRNATIKFVEQVDKLKPDIIHLHNLHGYYLNIEVLFNYLKQRDIPIVWTLHDCWALTGHCTHFDFFGCDRWKTECHHCPQKKEYPASFGFDRSKKNYNVKKQLFTSIKNLNIVSVSKWLGGIIEQSFLSKFHIQVINNGIDIETFSPQNNTAEIREKYGIGNRFMMMGVASSWSVRKGLDDYVRLSENLTNDSVIVLVGLSKAQLNTLPQTIIGIARTDNISELAKLYSTANIILNLSAEETFGLTTVEGFACGTPGIVYNCTASPELVTPETGLVVEKGDILGLINAIQIIKKRGKSSYSSACVERAKKLYNKDDRFLDYIDLYESLLKRNINNLDGTANSNF